MPFGNLMRKTAHKANNFFGTVKNYTKKGVAFLNNKVIPTARAGHKFITAASEEISKDPNVSDKNRGRLKTLSNLADVGIRKLEDTAATVNRVRAAV